MFKKAMGVLAALVLAGTAVVASPAPAAEAAYTCSGRKIDTVKHYNYQGTLVANTGIYLDGFDVCAVTVKTGPLYGHRTGMRLTVTKTYQGGKVVLKDWGQFRYQTNALTRGVIGGCVIVRAQVQTRAGNWTPELTRKYCYR